MSRVGFLGPVFIRWPVTVRWVEFFSRHLCIRSIVLVLYALPLMGVTLSPFVTSVVVLGGFERVAVSVARSCAGRI